MQFVKKNDIVIIGTRIGIGEATKKKKKHGQRRNQNRGSEPLQLKGTSHDFIFQSLLF